MLKTSGILIIFSLFASLMQAETSFETGTAGNSAAQANFIADKPDTKNFRGRINGTTFRMRLTRDGVKLSGTYFYTKIGRELKLAGTIDAAGKFKLKETDPSGKNTGEWQGTWTDDANNNGLTLQGIWKKPGDNNDGGFSFYATEQVIEFTNGAKFLDKTIKEIDKTKRSEIVSVYPEITGVDSAAAANLNKLTKDLVTAANDGYKKAVADFSAAEIKELPEGISLSNEVGYDVALANNDLVSLIFYNYNYLAGVHGNTASATINYDLKNNRELGLDDIFEPDSNYLKTISDYSIADLKKRVSEMSDDEWIGRGAGANADNFQNWNLTKKGLMFTFDQYQVAAYAAGPQTVIIPFDKLKNILRKDGAAANLAK